MRFRRKPGSADTGSADPAGEATDESTGAADVTGGPFDAEELPDDGVERVDLGSLLVAPGPGRDLRVQVDERSGSVRSVVLAGQDGAVELRAYAAPRNGDLWDEIRPQIAADAARKGGTATEEEGRFGTELVCEVQVRTQEGQTGKQVSRVVGINGPRWLLRATFLGRPARDQAAMEEWASALTTLAVRRGTQAMPVGEQLPLTLPEAVKQARQQQAEQSGPAGTPDQRGS